MSALGRTEDGTTWKCLLLDGLADVGQHASMIINKAAGREVQLLHDKIKIAPMNKLDDGKWIVTKIEADIMLDTSIDKIKPRHLDSMTRSFHAAVQSEESREHIKSLGMCVGIVLKHVRLIHWLLCKSLLKLLIKNSCPIVQIEPSTKPDNCPPLTEGEMQTLRYVGGFLIRKLMKHVQDDDESKEALQILIEKDISARDTDKFMDYTHDMVNAHDRGALIHIKDQFFSLLVTFERLVKSHCTLQVENLKDVLETSLHCVAIEAQWDDTIGGNLTDEKRSKLFDLLIEDYIVLRINAYADSYNFILRHETARGRKSMRHELE